ncbi:MAG: ABC transporter permease [Planctomycetota bacterium]
MKLLGIVRKELLSLFVSPLAFVTLFVFLFVNGLFFYNFLRLFEGNLEFLIQRQFGGDMSFWLFALLLPPLLTMRSFAEETRAGSYELLITSGIGEVRLVIAKFLSAWIFFVFLWLATGPIYLLIASVGDVDWGVMLALFVGLVALGALFTSVGIFASTITQYQLLSAIAAFVINLLIFSTSFFGNFLMVGDWRLRIVDYVSPLHHFGEDFTQGVIDARYLVYYTTLAGFFLFLAVKNLERRRWW